jgi:acetyl esterase/lipase
MQCVRILTAASFVLRVVLGLPIPAATRPAVAAVPSALTTTQQISDDGSVRVSAMQLPYSAFASAEAKQKFLEKTSTPPPAGYNVEELRRFYGRFNQRLVARMRKTYAVTETREVWNGVPVLRVRPKNGVSASNSHRILVNLHGGAFMWGGGAGEEVEAIPIAAVSGIEVVSLDYRLAPEHPYPAALNDTEKVYRSLLQDYQPGDIGIYGCSAGAILASESIARFLQDHLPLPGALGTFCGAALPFAGDSTYIAPYSVNEPLMDGQPDAMAANAYFHGADPYSAMIFPALSAQILRHFPPTLLLSGTRDQALSSCVESELALRRAGVVTEMHVWDGMWHAFFVDPDMPESREAFGMIARFFERHLNPESKA